MPKPAKPRSPIGQATRGTTGVNRLRRVDRWLTAHGAFIGREAPFVVDLGFGATGWTTIELAERCLAVRPRARVLGIEIDPERVAAAEALRQGLPPERRSALAFALGGFEVPTPPGLPHRPDVIRAMNVLRQYAEHEVEGAWRLMLERLAPGGALIEGTCSEIGRVGSWVTLDAAGPRTLTLSLHLESLEQPSVLAERLPKALIHRNVAGEPIHALLGDFDRAWAEQASLSTFGARQRFLAAVRGLRERGWPIEGDARRWRLGEVTLPWASVAPVV